MVSKKIPLDKKSAVHEIQSRFDQYVESFSHLETGQRTLIDSPIMQELISTLPARTNPNAKHMLDIGCGAGNCAIKLVRQLNGIHCDLVDLSQPMLDKARERMQSEPSGDVRLFQGDFREVELPENHYDIIVTSAVFHHLRDDQDWHSAYQKVYNLLVKGGSVWICDLIAHDHKVVDEEMWKRYGDYLEGIGGPEMRQKIFDYIAEEDSPRSLTYQLDLMKQVGFETIEILHKNILFTAFMGIK